MYGGAAAVDMLDISSAYLHVQSLAVSVADLPDASRIRLAGFIWAAVVILIRLDVDDVAKTRRGGGEVVLSLFAAEPVLVLFELMAVLVCDPQLDRIKGRKHRK